MRRTHSKRGKPFRYSGLLLVLCTFWVIAALLFVERSGIRYTAVSLDQAYLDTENSLQAEQVHHALKKTCLLLTNSQDTYGEAAVAEIEQILLDMKVGYTPVDVTAADHYNFDDYETVVAALSDISPMEETVLELSDWVKHGGSALFTMPLEQNRYSMLLEPKLGILSSGYEYARIESCYWDEGFMLGGGRSYPVPDPFPSSRPVTLNDRANVYVWNDGEKKTPLIWEHPYGKGEFVVVNLGRYEKSVRGFYAAAYSLLTDCVVYPVINGAAFYLDDFPSPVPRGNDSYIKRDYGLSIDHFYSSVWWPDMQKLASQYDIKYTGALMESYGNDTTGDTVTPYDTRKFLSFGNMILHQQGEIGYHGYNHQPLCLGSFSYPDTSPYKTWASEAAMKSAMTELVTFADTLFPTAQKAIYVPPSNILSPEGRHMLCESFPQIRTIASYYLPAESVYHQEFEVSDDGIIEQPRLTSGFIPDDAMMLTAVSELNMHFVNNHSLRPNDVLDENCSAEQGWENLKKSLDGYMNWLYTSAPQLDPLTGSQLSGRIQRFAAVSAEKTVENNHIHLKIHNLYDSAYFMIRFNTGVPQTVTGGTLEPLTGNLYLLRAEAEDVTITISR